MQTALTCVVLPDADFEAGRSSVNCVMFVILHYQLV